jgi:hypothetical protein
VDPFDEFVLDEAFVRAATVVELSAAERAEIDERRRHREALARYESARDSDDAAEAEQARWRARRRRVVRVVAWLVLGGLVGWALWVAVALRRPDERPEPVQAPAAAPDLRHYGSANREGRPTPLGLASATPLGKPPAVAGPDEGYEFSSTQDFAAAPVTYDPCRPVHYVTSNRTAVDGSDELVASAVDEISAATGLRFVSDGPTDEAPSVDRAFYQPGRYGDAWAPVLIAWSDDTESPGLAGSVAGLGGSAYLKSIGADAPAAAKVYVSGAVTLDGPDLREVEATQGRAAVRAVVLHELAHVVGLDHVNDRRQLMYPEAVAGVVDLGAGDRRGLAQLGAGDCHPEV